MRGMCMCVYVLMKCNVCHLCTPYQTKLFTKLPSLPALSLQCTFSPFKPLILRMVSATSRKQAQLESQLGPLRHLTAECLYGQPWTQHAQHSPSTSCGHPSACHSASGSCSFAPLAACKTSIWKRQPPPKKIKKMVLVFTIKHYHISIIKVANAQWACCKGVPCEEDAPSGFSTSDSHSMPLSSMFAFFRT